MAINFRALLNVNKKKCASRDIITTDYQNNDQIIK